MVKGGVKSPSIMQVCHLVPEKYPSRDKWRHLTEILNPIPIFCLFDQLLYLSVWISLFHLWVFFSLVCICGINKLLHFNKFSSTYLHIKFSPKWINKIFCKIVTNLNFNHFLKLQLWFSPLHLLKRFFFKFQQKRFCKSQVIKVVILYFYHYTSWKSLSP